jgi:hypothetical protein
MRRTKTTANTKEMRYRRARIIFHDEARSDWGAQGKARRDRVVKLEAGNEGDGAAALDRRNAEDRGHRLVRSDDGNENRIEQVFSGHFDH